MDRDTWAGEPQRLFSAGTERVRPQSQRRWPPQASSVDLLDVPYAHLSTSDGGDLYVTEFGLAFWEHLLPENWFAPEWFEAKRERLLGTSIVYKVPTRRVRDRIVQLVVKWSRVGEDVPLDTLTINKFINAEFNSPFEEFALVMELRAGVSGPAAVRILTQRPLGIYVPSERLQLWQTGRSESKIAAKIARAPGVELDILRQYVLLYGWIKGRDLVEVADDWGLRDAERAEFLDRANSLVIHELEQKGYRVVDMKPAHVIVRPQPDRTLRRDPQGHLVYALIDYELLERTPDHEQAVRTQHRQYYLRHMARRFESPADQALPAHLKPAQVLGVDYIFGHAESTGGSLWVVGNDPALFNFFLPERWRRTPKRALSASQQAFHTRTKDSINLVWKVSRVGDVPALDGPEELVRAQVEHGYNSPFEEFAYALELSRAGLPTVYPRAIYMTGRKTDTLRTVADPRRYAALEQVRTPEGRPTLRRNHDYIAIWGFWNGPDELLAAKDGQYYRAVNAEQATRDRLITRVMLEELLESVRDRLAPLGFADLNLQADHLLLSFGPDDALVTDSAGRPEVRLCNLELLRRLPPPAPAPS
ncbi:MAG: hypothetical protein FJ387_30985 [Verrucomicrobia bacterium]|nr:hypothetical protein [Verrucomicrobiota bacterium]